MKRKREKKGPVGDREGEKKTDRQRETEACVGGERKRKNDWEREEKREKQGKKACIEYGRNDIKKN